MQYKFSKYHGAGNDFVMIDNREDNRQTWDILTPEFIQKLCHRHYGIGADGVIIAVKSNDKNMPYTMGYFNADGSPAEMCGNGLRCLMLFLSDMGEDVRSRDEVTILTGAGPVHSRFTDNNTIQVMMPNPSFNPNDAGIVSTENAIRKTISVPGLNYTVTGSAVGIGNPHFVIYNNEMWEGDEIHSIGHRLEIHEELFPEGVNVGFARKESPDAVGLVVWERGVGPTLACGSGAVAAVAVGIAENRFEFDQRVHVRMPGGDLYVTIGNDWSSAMLEGEAEKVFDGYVNI